MSTTLLERPVVIQEEEFHTVQTTEQMTTTATTSVLRHNYDKVFEDGTLVSLHVRCWGMAAQLSEDDLAIGKQPNIFKLGKKMLIKPEIFNEFKRLEGKGRAILGKAGFDFPISEAHFIPKARLITLIEDLTKVKKEFDEYKELFYQKYEEYKEDVLTSFPELRAKLEPCYPSLETIKTKFAFNWAKFRIAMPKEFGEHDLSAEMAEEKVVTEAQKKAQAELKAEAEKQIQLMQSFVQDIGEDLRSKVLHGCQKIAEKILNKEVVSKTNIDSLLKQINNFKELNFLDDKAVENGLDDLRKLITDGSEDFKQNPVSLEKLQSTLNQVIDTAKNISDVSSVTGKYFRSIQLED
jgi:hypothetical protein